MSERKLSLQAQMNPWFEKAKTGFITGSAVGATIGLLYGSYHVLTMGPTPGRGYLQTVGTYMLQHGSMLGLFLSIGSLMRNEEGRDAPAFPMRRLPVVILQSRSSLVDRLQTK
ncbi:reactive mitochondrial oxygen species modulator 1-domain-containing protein [Entophlyctis helioformis]|nr:reactive mitochondrial oxygen species modulator 1-domain-containing protein [Entophlyctis helioformis]